MKCPNCGYVKSKKINIAKLLKGRKIAIERMVKNHGK